jgi:hypothetical protein
VAAAHQFAPFKPSHRGFRSSAWPVPLRWMGLHPVRLRTLYPDLPLDPNDPLKETYEAMAAAVKEFGD